MGLFFIEFSTLFKLLIGLGVIGLAFKKYGKGGKIKTLKNALIGSVTDELERPYFIDLVDLFFTVIQGAQAGLVVALIVASPDELKMQSINFWLAGWTLLAVFLTRLSFEFLLAVYNYVKNK